MRKAPKENVPTANKSIKVGYILKSQAKDSFLEPSIPWAVAMYSFLPWEADFVFVFGKGRSQNPCAERYSQPVIMERTEAGQRGLAALPHPSCRTELVIKCLWASVFLSVKAKSTWMGNAAFVKTKHRLLEALVEKNSKRRTRRVGGRAKPGRLE